MKKTVIALLLILSATQVFSQNDRPNLKISIDSNNSISVDDKKVLLTELKEKIKTHYQKHQENTKVIITANGNTSMKTIGDVIKAKDSVIDELRNEYALKNFKYSYDKLGSVFKRIVDRKYPE